MSQITALAILASCCAPSAPTAGRISEEIRSKHGVLETVRCERASSITFPSGDKQIAVIASLMTCDGKTYSVARLKTGDGMVEGGVVFRTDGRRFETKILGEVPVGGCRGFGWMPDPQQMGCYFGGMFTSKIWKDGRYFHDFVEDIRSGTYVGEEVLPTRDANKKCDVVEVLRKDGDEVRGTLRYYIGVDDRLLWRYVATQHGSGVVIRDDYLSWAENPEIDPDLFAVSAKNPVVPSQGEVSGD